MSLSVTEGHGGDGGRKGRGVPWVQTAKRTAWRIYPPVCPSQLEVGLRFGHVVAAKTVLITWDSGHPLTCLEPPSPPHQALMPHLPLSAPIPSQIPRPEPCWPFWGSTGKEGGMERCSESGEGGARGPVGMVTGPILRPEVHHRDLKDHWGPR